MRDKRLPGPRLPRGIDLVDQLKDLIAFKVKKETWKGQEHKDGSMDVAFKQTIKIRIYKKSQEMTTVYKYEQGRTFLCSVNLDDPFADPLIRQLLDLEVLPSTWVQCFDQADICI